MVHNEGVYATEPVGNSMPGAIALFVVRGYTSIHLLLHLWGGEKLLYG